MISEQLFFTFFAIWILLAISSLVFYRTADLQMKRRWHPRLVVVSGVLFLGFVSLMMPPWPTLAIAAPAVALIAYLNLTLTKFCPRCGAVLFRQNWFSKMDFCQSCGAALNQEAPHA